MESIGSHVKITQVPHFQRHYNAKVKFRIKIAYLEKMDGCLHFENL